METHLIEGNFKCPLKTVDFSIFYNFLFKFLQEAIVASSAIQSLYYLILNIFI